MNKLRKFGRDSRVSIAIFKIKQLPNIAKKSLLSTCVFLFANISSPFALAETDYTLFESGQVRPLALAPNGRYLYSINTPDNRLEIFEIKGKSLVPISSVSVGLEPVAVEVAPNGMVWVVNHLSDSITVIDASSPTKPYVKRTIRVGDEPRDIVFGGYDKSKAFVTTAARGQNHPSPASLTEAGLGRADVWVFDSQRIHFSQKPTTIIRLFTDTPRALAVSPDGLKVYAAGFNTGNQTTVIFEELVPDGGVDNGGLPSVRTDAANEAQPETGLIVKFNGSHWVDELGRIWDDKVKFSLPDTDVFVIDAALPVPKLRQGTSSYRGVGTNLFNMVVNPTNGKVYVSNTEALNEKRFEGHGTRLGKEHTLQGHFYDNRITVLDGKKVLPRNLNKHIDYTKCCDPVPNNESETSLATPMGMTVSADGKTLFMAAFGSSKLGVFNTAQLESNQFTPSRDAQVELTGGGPTGVVFDARRNQVYVLTRFDNGISVVDVAAKREVSHVAMFSPEPNHIVEGRRFLYDARYTSSHGDSSCGSCHIFGDVDSLAWDLGNPDEISVVNSGPFAFGPSVLMPDGSIANFNPDFRALKGPMTTQSLRGMDNHGPMHWRGDRTGGNDDSSIQPNRGAYNERAAFEKFNVAFSGLIGRDQGLTDQEMAKFTDFVLEMTYPPNPIRNLDNSLTAQQAAGKDFFFGDISDGAFNCNGCHILDPQANSEYGVAKPGFFGTDGRYALVPEPQFMKVPHLRNMYQKVGMFGMHEIPSGIPGDNGFKGDQVKGFGFFHDGSVDTIFRFHGATIFIARPTGFLGEFDVGNPGGFPFVPLTDPNADLINPIGEQKRREIEAFMFVFDSNVAPIVGQQATLSINTSSEDMRMAQLLVRQADKGECDLVGKLWNGQREVGVLYKNGSYQIDRSNISPLPLSSLQQVVGKLANVGGAKSLTLTCVPPGSGTRIALDRNRDGILDGDLLSKNSPASDVLLSN